MPFALSWIWIPFLIHHTILLPPDLTYALISPSGSAYAPRFSHLHRYYGSKKSIFVLAGQSNMSGRGGVLNDTSTGVATWDGDVPRPCRPNRAILRLDAKLRWVEAREPLHQDVDVNKTCGVGPGMAFAHTVLRRGTGLGLVGLVPCAVGGTRIDDWARGTALYTQMVNRTRAAVREGGGRIEAVVWYQGESDTLSREDAESYGGRLERLFSDLRDDLRSPMLPIILVAITSGEGPYVETVRQAQLGFNLLNVKVVDAKGLPLGPDHLHLTTPAQVHLGKILGRSYLGFLPAIPSPVQRIVTSAGTFPLLHHSRGFFWRRIIVSLVFFVPQSPW